MTEVSKLDQLVDRCDTLVHGIIMNDAEALRLCVWTIAACLDDAKAELLRLRSGITPLDVVRIVECEEAIRATTLEAKDREIERLTAERDAARRDASQYERMHIDALQTASDEMDRASTLTRQLEETRCKAVQHGRAETYMSAASGWQRRADAAEAALQQVKETALEEAAKVAERKAEAQSQFQKSAYSRGDDLGGHGHWKAQCELLAVAAAIRSLKQGERRG